MSQTSVNLYSAPAFAGMLADTGNHDILSYSAEFAVPFGSFVILGSNKERQVAAAGVGAGNASVVIGVAVATQTVEQTSAGLAQYAQYNTVSVLKSGRIWMATDDAVVAGTTANLKLSSGKVTDEAVAAGIEAFTQIGVKFITGTSAAGLALVEVIKK